MMPESAVADPQLQAFVGEWWRTMVRAGSEPGRYLCAKLLRAFLARWGSRASLEVARFADLARYPERPMLRVGGLGAEEPVLWLLGWRQGDATPIHDHRRSEVAVYVLRGSVEERVWWPTSAPVGGTARAQRVVRELHAGSLVTIPEPYVHRVSNPASELGASLHAYYPSLSSMTYFEEAEEGGLVSLHEVGAWEEVGHAASCRCRHDPASCGDRGCHAARRAA